MTKLRLVLLLLLLLVGLRWLACRPGDGPGRRPSIANRVWVDKIASGPRDLVLRLVLLDRKGMKRGLSVVASKYRASGDRLGWRLDRKTLTLEVLQERQKVTFEATISRCDGPGRYDLCLDLRSGRQILRLYGMERSFGVEALAEDEAPLFLATLEAEAESTPSADGAPPAASSLRREPSSWATASDALPAWFLERSEVVR